MEVEEVSYVRSRHDIEEQRQHRLFGVSLDVPSNNCKI